MFGKNNFLEYLKANLDIKFLIFDKVFLYPKMIDLYIDNILTISEEFLEIIFSNLDFSYILNLIIISKKIIQKMTESLDKSNKL